MLLLNNPIKSGATLSSSLTSTSSTSSYESAPGKLEKVLKLKKSKSCKNQTSSSALNSVTSAMTPNGCMSNGLQTPLNVINNNINANIGYGSQNVTSSGEALDCQGSVGQTNGYSIQNILSFAQQYASANPDMYGAGSQHSASSGSYKRKYSYMNGSETTSGSQNFSKENGAENKQSKFIVIFIFKLVSDEHSSLVCHWYYQYFLK